MEEKKSVKDVKVGDVFNYLTIIDTHAGMTKDYNRLCRWRCICGEEGIGRLGQIVRGVVKSCGKCWNKNPFNKSTLNDLTGKRFGRWTVLHLSNNRTNDNKLLWVCQCDCGEIREVKASSLVSGKSSSCGCLHKEIVSANSFVDITGRQFGRLTALEYVGVNKFQCRLWRCVCSCGNEIITTYSNLIKGDTQSCGCLREERLKEVIVKHGMHSARIYKLLTGMKQRCYNINNPEYYNYGGRGITICDEWLDSENGFMNFYDWAVSHGYRDGLFIERIDVNGPYAPWNCKWITNQEQQWNKRDTIKTIDGYPIAQFSYNYGIPWRHIRDHNPDVESITVEELYERYFWPNDEPIIW